MYRTANETARLLAVILKRGGHTRARVSGQTIKFLAQRRNLRSAFVLEVIAALADRYDWVLCELPSGGYGAVQAKALEAAKAVTAKRLMTEDERRDLRRGTADLEAFESEAAPDREPPEDDND